MAVSQSEVVVAEGLGIGTAEEERECFSETSIHRGAESDLALVEARATSDDVFVMQVALSRRDALSFLNDRLLGRSRRELWSAAGGTAV